MAEKNKVPMGTRYDALRMIPLDDWQKSRPLLAKHLGKDAHPELQMGAISGLADVEHPESAKLLLNHVAHLAPGNRKLALEGVLKTDAGATTLLSAAEQGQVALTALTKEQRENLLNRSDASIRQRARKLLGADQ